MAHLVQTQVKAWLAQWDVSGDINACALSYGADAVEDTMFGDTTHKFLGGLKKTKLSLAGAWNSAIASGQSGGNLDSALFGNMLVTGQPLTVGPMTGADGELAYLLQPLQAEYGIAAKIGAKLDFTLAAEALTPLVRGTIMHNATRGVTGVGTARQLGAVAAGQNLYASLHVLTASGSTPTLDVTVKSAAASNMAGATTRITFTQKTALGAEWKSVAGAITDDWWQVAFAIGGGSPSFQFVVGLGIV